jgi:hypothetical protein
MRQVIALGHRRKEYHYGSSSTRDGPGLEISVGLKTLSITKEKIIHSDISVKQQIVEQHRINICMNTYNFPSFEKIFSLSMRCIGNKENIESKTGSMKVCHFLLYQMCRFLETLQKLNTPSVPECKSL